MIEKKQAYEKPALRKVRLEVRTSVLATCHLSGDFAMYPCEGSSTCWYEAATPPAP